MYIRKVVNNEIARVMEIIDQAKIMMGKVSNQWQNGYPNAGTIASDIEKGVGYVLVDENEYVLGYAAIIEGPDPWYAEIEGEWLTNGSYHVIHRIAVDEAYRGKGLAHYFFEFARDMNDVLRVDTHSANLPMQRCIQKENFKYCGIVYVNEHQPRYAYEWKKEENTNEN